MNNAGVIERAEVPFVEDDVEDTWRVIEANVRGPLLVTHAVLPGMLARGEGRVLNLNSGAGHRAMTVYTGYAISKGALARFTTQLRRAVPRPGHPRARPGARARRDGHDGRRCPCTTGRTEWTPVEAVVELVRAFGDGELDALSGRFVRAGTDTVESLLAALPQILATDARTLRLGAYGDEDPVA